MTPTVYTRALHDRLVKSLRAGSTFRDACEAAGLGWQTWKDWRKAVVDGIGTVVHPGIRTLVEEAYVAHGEATQSLTASVKIAATKDYRAALGLLDFRAGAERRRWEARRAYYEAEIARRKASGTYVAQHGVEHSGSVAVTTDALLGKLGLDADDDGGGGSGGGGSGGADRGGSSGASGG